MRDKQSKFRKPVPGRCQYCGREFSSDKHARRRRLFCDKKCRDGEFRRLRYLTPKNVEIGKKPKQHQRFLDPILAIDPHLVGVSPPVQN